MFHGKALLSLHFHWIPDLIYWNMGKERYTLHPQIPIEPLTESPSPLDANTSTLIRPSSSLNPSSYVRHIPRRILLFVIRRAPTSSAVQGLSYECQPRLLTAPFDFYFLFCSSNAFFSVYGRAISHQQALLGFQIPHRSVGLGINTIDFGFLKVFFLFRTWTGSAANLLMDSCRLSPRGGKDWDQMCRTIRSCHVDGSEPFRTADPARYGR